MSKITNDGLTQSDTGCFIAVHTKHIATVGRQRVKWAVVNHKVWCCNERYQRTELARAAPLP